MLSSGHISNVSLNFERLGCCDYPVRRAKAASPYHSLHRSRDSPKDEVAFVCVGDWTHILHMLTGTCPAATEYTLPEPDYLF